MGRYRCTCTPGRHTDDEAARDAWGCTKRAKTPVFGDPISGGFNGKHFDLYRCPASQVGPEWESVVATWRVFGGSDNFGPLPLAGGWLDQMQWFADAHGILANERQLYLDAKAKESEAKRKTKGK